MMFSKKETKTIRLQLIHSQQMLPSVQDVCAPPRGTDIIGWLPQRSSSLINIFSP